MDKNETYAFARWLLEELKKRSISRTEFARLAQISRGAAYGYTAVDIASALIPDEALVPRLLCALGLEPDHAAGWDAWRDACRGYALTLSATIPTPADAPPASGGAS